MLAPFRRAVAGHARNALALPAAAAPYPDALAQRVLSPALCAEAQSTIQSWDGYAATPLHNLAEIAAEAGIGALHYKDEGSRFGLGSFKALGGAFAVERVLRREGVEPDKTLRSQSAAGDGDGMAPTVVSATDGNHGRSVAWGARRCGVPCVIYMHHQVSAGRVRAVEALGARVEIVQGTYDDSVRQAASDAATNKGWHVVSDTSYEGYEEVPRWVMAGYTLMSAEAAPDPPPTHVFVQGGVGGLAAAVLCEQWMRWGAARPRVVVVEPTRADCLFRSAEAGVATSMYIEEESVMGGLSAGDPSLVAWEALALGAHDFLRVEDDAVVPAMRLLATSADGGIVAGESGVAGLVGLLGAATDPNLAQALGLDGDSRVLVFGSEGATDPGLWKELVEGS